MKVILGDHYASQTVVGWMLRMKDVLGNLIVHIDDKSDPP